MGQVPRELTPLESALHFFGAELRHWRTLRELSHELAHHRLASIHRLPAAISG